MNPGDMGGVDLTSGELLLCTSALAYVQYPSSPLEGSKSIVFGKQVTATLTSRFSLQTAVTFTRLCVSSYVISAAETPGLKCRVCCDSCGYFVKHTSVDLTGFNGHF